MISLSYFALLVIVACLVRLIHRQRIRTWLLIAASAMFVYGLDRHSLILVGVLTTYSYLLGHLIHRRNQKSLWHFMAICGLLMVLAMFKYQGMLGGISAAINDLWHSFPQYSLRKLAVPLGISYLIFKQISYLTDIKWGIIKPGRWDDLLLYSSLFTIFVAGPIERFERFQNEISGERKSDWNDLDTGLVRIVRGLGRKLIIADWLGYFTAPVWRNPQDYSPWIGLLALLGFSFQIYHDFAGYSDIAIGSSRLLGIRVMENFDNPYLAPNISQFWRRWHISLSDWIRDYIFFPLSSLSSKPLWQKLAVPLIAMALCGFWHGAESKFILWGAIHGMGIAVFQYWNEIKRKDKKLVRIAKQPIFQYLATSVTFVFVSLAWMWFR